jgi:hypothetical protein
MECLVPAALLRDFKAAPGARLGLNLNLKVSGIQVDREVFWTTPKSDGIDQPAAWGTITLAK